MTFKRLMRLYALYAKMDFAWLLRDAWFAVLAIVSEWISNIAAITGVFLLAWRFDGIGGMDKFEVLLMLAYYTVVTGVYQLFFASNNTGHISRRIGRGQFEHMLVQPVPLAVQLLTEGFIPFSGSSKLISGVVIMCIAVAKLGLPVTWWWVLSVAGNVAVTIAIILGQSYLYSSLAFYAPVQAEEISTYAIDNVGYISSFPLSGMPVYMQLPLITVIPSGLLAWFPTLALLGKPPLGLPGALPLLFAVVLAALASILFRKGFRYYVQKGTNRYLAWGHRR